LVVLPSLAAARPVVFKAARLYDGRSEAVATPGVLVVDGDKIIAVGPKAAVPEGAEVIDLGDATLLPGLMDAHTQLQEHDPRARAGCRCDRAAHVGGRLHHRP
jgi:imidazolonepropionase-like amidohydrolase